MITRERKIMLISNALVWTAVAFGLHKKQGISVRREQVACQHENKVAAETPDQTKVIFKDCKP